MILPLVAGGADPGGDEDSTYTSTPTQFSPFVPSSPPRPSLLSPSLYHVVTLEHFFWISLLAFRSLIIITPNFRLSTISVIYLDIPCIM